MGMATHGAHLHTVMSSYEPRIPKLQQPGEEWRWIPPYHMENAIEDEKCDRLCFGEVA
jgi:hypothetical protein